MARKRGCDGKPAPSIVEVDKDEKNTYVYYNCPKLFIPTSIHRWFQEYSYHKRFTSAPMPTYEKISRRFITAVNVYEDTMQTYQEKLDKLNK